MNHDHDDPGSSTAHELLRQRYDANAASFSRAERLVADHLLQLPPAELAFLSGDMLAQSTGTSDATVIRTARRLGFSGLPELKRQVTRSIARTSSVPRRLERRYQAVGSDAGTARDAVFAAALELVEATQQAVDPDAIDRAVAALEGADTVWCLGMGTSEQPARHLAIGLLRAGLRTRVLASSNFTLANDVVGMRSGDVLVVFQAAVQRKDIEALIAHANAIGAKTILVSGVQLHEAYRERVTVAIQSMGVASKLASSAIGAMVVADLLTHCLAAGNVGRAIDTHARLGQLRQSVE
ncbi:MurR/RpiR family transcriptional regulator [Devosia sp. 2618]|uniref:MurR/RpiR family transcriptional regulator n=1 Tax=Devosia sp. 2618 TaxID=3156454 RepID=UPI003394D64A